jgi:hypothetical protein
MATGLINTAVDVYSNLNNNTPNLGIVPATNLATAVPVVATPQQSALTAGMATPTAVPSRPVVPANVASVPVPVAPVTREIKPEETVSGQLNKLLADDSKYIQSARNAAMTTANQRGLLNSSIAAGSGERAAIDAALPIATSDANVYSQSGLSAQQSGQDMGLTRYKSLLDSAQQQQNFGYNTALNNQNISGNMLIGKQAQDAALVIKNLDVTQVQKTSLLAAISPIIQQVQSEISLIERTPDTTLDANGKATAITFQNQLLQAQLKTISSLYGYEINWDVPATPPPPVNPYANLNNKITGSNTNWTTNNNGIVSSRP